MLTAHVGQCQSLWSLCHLSKTLGLLTFVGLKIRQTDDTLLCFLPCALQRSPKVLRMIHQECLVQVVLPALGTNFHNNDFTVFRGAVI